MKHTSWEYLPPLPRSGGVVISVPLSFALLPSLNGEPAASPSWESWFEAPPTQLFTLPWAFSYEGSSPSLPWPTTHKLSQLESLHFDVKPEIMQVVFDEFLRGTCVHNEGRCFRSPPLPHATISRYPSSLGDEMTLLSSINSPSLISATSASSSRCGPCLQCPRTRFSASSRYFVLTRSRHYLVSRN